MKNPFPATVLGVRSVTKPGSAKETIHVDYSLEGSGLTYTTGDALGVIPCNDPELVDALISALGLDANADRKSTRLNSSHYLLCRMPSSA